MKNKKEKSNKPTRRSKVKHASLNKRFNSRIKQEYLDADYLEKLSASELDWYAKFMDEWNGASFQKDGNDIDQTAEGRKASYDRNNARNRCLYGHLKNKTDKFNNKKLLNFDQVIGDVEVELSQHVTSNTIEDAYIDFLESKEIKEMIKDYEVAMTSFRIDNDEYLDPIKNDE